MAGHRNGLDVPTVPLKRDGAPGSKSLPAHGDIRQPQKLAVCYLPTAELWATRAGVTIRGVQLDSDGQGSEIIRTPSTGGQAFGAAPAHLFVTPRAGAMQNAGWP